MNPSATLIIVGFAALGLDACGSGNAGTSGASSSAGSSGTSSTGAGGSNSTGTGGFGSTTAATGAGTSTSSGSPGSTTGYPACSPPTLSASCPPCATTADCPDAVSICTGPMDQKTCTVNTCPTAGAVCDIDLAGSGGGTCVPMDAVPSMYVSFHGEPDYLLCVPSGTASSCQQGANNDDPYVAEVVNPQPRDSTSFCPQGDGCFAPLTAVSGNDNQPGQCTPLCIPDAAGSGCVGQLRCEQQDARDSSWGFCLPCLSSGSDGGAAGTCIADSDCCEGNCPVLPGNGYAYCAP